MRVLGVDPGLTRCGLGIVDGSRHRTASLVHVEVLRTSSTDELAQRLGQVHTRVAELLEQFRPDAVAVERVFSQANLRTVMGTAQAGGVAVLAAAQAGVPVTMHTPSEIKASVTGSGRAGKAQVTSMVTHILRLPQRPSPADAADALALALCHLWRGPVLERPGRPVTQAQQQWAQAQQQSAQAPRQWPRSGLAAARRR
ncbi:MAG: crossover junction endodeoxyribonuclease RuvC [Micrococcales bacterium]|nr:MAG: crossover junction endodeoxyribonuclease RuvC [Micrococcales bacterium]